MRKTLLALLLPLFACNIPEIKADDINYVDSSGVCHVAVIVPATCDDVPTMEQMIDEQIPAGTCVFFACECSRRLYCKL